MFAQMKKNLFKQPEISVLCAVHSEPIIGMCQSCLEFCVVCRQCLEVSTSSHFQHVHIPNENIMHALSTKLNNYKPYMQNYENCKTEHRKIFTEIDQKVNSWLEDLKKATILALCPDHENFDFMSYFEQHGYERLIQSAYASKIKLIMEIDAKKMQNFDITLQQIIDIGEKLKAQIQSLVGYINLNNISKFTLNISGSSNQSFQPYDTKPNLDSQSCGINPNQANLIKIWNEINNKLKAATLPSTNQKLFFCRRITKYGYDNMGYGNYYKDKQTGKIIQNVIAGFCGTTKGVKPEWDDLDQFYCCQHCREFRPEY